jgi:hypothetical protein
LSRSKYENSAKKIIKTCQGIKNAKFYVDFKTVEKKKLQESLLKKRYQQQSKEISSFSISFHDIFQRI